MIVSGGCKQMEAPPGKSWSYFFDKPAKVWEETLPLGNGRIGLMPDGQINKENIVLNEISMWSGSKQDTDNPEAYKSLAQIRKLLFEGKNDEAQSLMYKTFVCKGLGSGQGNGADTPYGSYQLLGNLVIEYQYPNETDTISQYKRTLNLNDAVASTSFKRGNVLYAREVFTSFADDLGVIHLSASEKSKLGFTIKMNRPERYRVSTEGNDLIMQGELASGTDAAGPLYGARVRVILPQNGDIVTSDSSLTITDATEAIILISMATNYFGHQVPDQLSALIAKAEGKSFDELKDDHIAAYYPKFNRVDLNLGESAASKLPINKRLTEFNKTKQDQDLMALYFQFGRYLLISSTREGLLPPNLQGLWCNTVRTPWNGDYHLNINLQMNLWPAEVTNLSELHRPLIEWTKKQVSSGEQTAKVFYNSRGWVTHILGNPWEFTAPGEHPSWGATNTSAAWLCQHLYHHYLYTMDKKYLAEVYPVLRGASLFFVDMLVEDPRNGYLVTAPTTSPENNFRMSNGSVVAVSAGSTMDNQLIRELFGNTMEAAEILGLDSVFVQELAAKRDKLMPTTIGKDGRIMEWLNEYEEEEVTHRHVSHLYGLHPGNEISVSQTPELAKAARATLEKRGDASTGWSMAWKVNFWARLHDGDRAHKLLSDLLRPCLKSADEPEYSGFGSGTYPNLFCAHPPFQIDGNFGGTAGIAEMLIQSQTGIIELLPALPSVWKNGSFRGLKVRGGAEMDVHWTNNRVDNATLRADVNNTFKIKIPAHAPKLSVKINGESKSLPVSDGILSLTMSKGDIADFIF